MLDVVSTPWCLVIRFEPWDVQAGRYFASYASRGSFSALVGHPVIDEFATLSSPIFVGSRESLGKMYDAGISLGHRRDPEMGLDLGWPPLCIGLDGQFPALPPDGQERLVEAASRAFDPSRPTAEEVTRRRGELRSWKLESLEIGEATVLTTTAPLLPRQLGRLCEVAGGQVVVAVSTGNRLETVPAGSPRSVRSLGERELDSLLQVARGLAP